MWLVYKTHDNRSENSAHINTFRISHISLALCKLMNYKCICWSSHLNMQKLYQKSTLMKLAGKYSVIIQPLNHVKILPQFFIFATLFLITTENAVMSSKSIYHLKSFFKRKIYLIEMSLKEINRTIVHLLCYLTL